MFCEVIPGVLTIDCSLSTGSFAPIFHRCRKGIPSGHFFTINECSPGHVMSIQSAIVGYSKVRDVTDGVDSMFASVCLSVSLFVRSITKTNESKVFKLGIWTSRKRIGPKWVAL